LVAVAGGIAVSEAYSIKLDGVEVARVTGDGVTPAKRVKQNGSLAHPELEDDDHLLRLIDADGMTIFVFYVAHSARVTVEKVAP
jgi:hypothetical protein